MCTGSTNNFKKEKRLMWNSKKIKVTFLKRKKASSIWEVTRNSEITKDEIQARFLARNKYSDLYK